MRIPFLARETNAAELAELRTELNVERNDREILEESFADLEAQILEPGWIRMSVIAEHEFSREGLRRIAAACRVMGIKNPLIVRGLALASAYVWGQGVEIAARANGQRAETGEQDVNSVIQTFMDNEGNQRVLSGEEAQVRNERTLRTDGNMFFVLFTKPLTGRVQVRTVPFAEIADILRNPEDTSEPQYYRRRWVEETTDPETGAVVSASREQLYPAAGYRPQVRPKRFGSVPVAWDAPIVHVKINDLDGWKYGLGDVYAAVDWALAYKDFLTDWARLMHSLARFAYKLTAKGSRGAAIARNRVAQPTTTGPGGESLAAGGIAAMTADVGLEAVSKSGATLDSESGRPLAAMVAAAMGVPVTMLLGDPGVTGARATAETLDQPTELGFQQRQAMWAAALRRILGYVIMEAVRAPQGPLKGKIMRDDDGRETLTLAGDTELTIDITWPDLDDIAPAVLVDAIVKANATGTIPPDLILQLLCSALGVRDVDEVLERMTDEEGNFLWPNSPPIGGQQAADAARVGQDPAATGPGSMTPDAMPADPTGGGGGSNPADTAAPAGTSSDGGGGG